jgi:hypothetical protein
MSVSTTFLHLALVQDPPSGWTKPVVFGNLTTPYAAKTSPAALGNAAQSFFALPAVDPSPYDGKYLLTQASLDSVVGGVYLGRLPDLCQGRPPALGDYILDQFGARWINVHDNSMLSWPEGATALIVEQGVTPAPATVNGRIFAFEALDTSAPLISVISPLTMQILGHNTPIIIEVKDSNFFARVVLAATLSGGVIEELIHDGVTTSVAYAVQRDSITDGYRYTIMRVGGWYGSSVTLKIISVDSQGNVATAKFTWQIVMP